MRSSTVTQCLSSLFCLFGFPGCVHSDRGAPFVSRETRSFLTTRTPYHPQGNNQSERSNQTIWRTIKLLLQSKRLSEEDWEAVLPEALHAVRSLVCLSTNETPHERFLRFPRKAMTGSAFTSWLLHPGPVLLRRHVRNKGDPLCDPVDLLDSNQTYSAIRLRDGQETTVSTSDLAPYPRCPVNTDEIASDVASNQPPPNSVENFSPASQLPMRRLHDRLTCILCHRARTRPRFRRMKMCNPYVGLRGQENPLIGLVTGPHNLRGGECGGFVASGRLHKLLLDCFVDCSPHRISLPCLVISCRTCALVSDRVELPTRRLLCYCLTSQMSLRSRCFLV